MTPLPGRNAPRLHLRPRLEAAAALLTGAATVADVGCDHGRLACALVQRDMCTRCIASDVSAPSLAKARALARLTGVQERIGFRTGDGLSVLREGEADAVALLGMGGTLMARLAVLQPMRAGEDIRRYLYAHGYRVAQDRVVADGGRLYEVFSVLPPAPGGRDGWPEGFPADCFTVGYRAFEQREPLLGALVRRHLAQCELRLRTARGTAGEERLLRRAAAMRAILEAYEGGSPCV